MHDTVFPALAGRRDRPLDSGRAAPGARKVPLPPQGTLRWVARRKAAVVEAVKSGQIAFDEACRLYGLSAEEFQSWQRQIERHGTGGLRVTRLQDYRAKLPSQIKG